MVRTCLCVTGFLLMVLLVGCGERNSPLVPAGYFQLVGEIQTPAWSKDVCALDDTAYVANNEGGIAIIEIHDFANPTYIGSWTTIAPVKMIKVAPLNRLLITYEDEAGSSTFDKLRMYSIDLHRQVTEDFDTGLTGFGFIEGDSTIWIYETDSQDGFQGNFYRKFGPDLWLRESSITPVQAPVGLCKGMVLGSSTNAFIALDERGVWSLDLTTTPLDSLSWLETPGAAYDVAYQDGYLYVANYFDGMTIIDASNPDSLVQVAQISPSGASRCEKVSVSGNKAALLDTYDGIYVIDISVPLSPSVVELIALPEPTGMSFYGDRLLVTDQDLGLLIYQP